jgi:transposase-like protein
MIMSSKSICRGDRFPADVIEHAVWLNVRCPLSLRMPDL